MSFVGESTDTVAPYISGFLFTSTVMFRKPSLVSVFSNPAMPSPCLWTTAP